MSKCESCEYYTYQCGVGKSLSKALGQSFPTNPTCHCNFANISWIRYSAEVKKPKGIPCEYKMKEMYCTECGKQLKNANDIWLKITSKDFICKKCGKLKEEEYENSQQK